MRIKEFFKEVKDLFAEFWFWETYNITGCGDSAIYSKSLRFKSKPDAIFFVLGSLRKGEMYHQGITSAMVIVNGTQICETPHTKIQGINMISCNECGIVWVYDQNRKRKITQ